MNIHFHKTQGRENGFSLVELLLTLVLILCLAAASVFTFTAIYRSSNLDEGVDRFESLIRFAQAEAAITGRKVRLQFVPARPTEANAEVELRNVKVTWEADMLNAPGVYAEYTNKAWSEEIVNELVGVEKVKTGSAAEGTGGSVALAAPAGSGVETSDGTSLEEGFPPVTFYPDGSCDSADIVLASRNPEDERRLAVHLSGLLGSVSKRTVKDEASEDFESGDEMDQDSFDDTGESDTSDWTEPAQVNFAESTSLP